jgi:hypothetical protein
VKSSRVFTLAVAAIVAIATLAVALKTQTLPAGTKIQCVLAEGVNSATLRVGTDFDLRIDDPAHPELADSSIRGHVVDVAQPAGLNRARIGFVLDYISLHGKRTPIHAEVVSRYVTQVNTAAARAEARRLLLPPMPAGTHTPGPIAWQITFRPGANPSVTPPPVGQSGGYVYAAKSNESIVIPPGTPVTIKLTNNLTVP